MKNGWYGTLGHVLVTLVLGFIQPELSVASVVFYFSREIAQAEYRYIETHGGFRYECPWYCGFLPESWTVKSILDWALPAIIAAVFILVLK
jgi:hypothetical protein